MRMFSTPRKSHRQLSPSVPASRKARLDGLFQDGQWFCNCDPRLAALRLQVKRNNKNKGRWFYTCQRERRDQCGFFLFEDTAQAREKVTLLRGRPSGRSTSPGVGPDSPVSRPLAESSLLGDSVTVTEALSRSFGKSTDLSVDEVPDARAHRSRNPKFVDWSSTMIRQAHEPGTNHNPTTPTGKRKLQSFHESNEPCDIDSDLSSDEERQLIHLVECSERKDKESTNQRLQPQDHFMTPIDRRRYDPMGGLPTPETGIDLTSGQSESKRRRLAPSIPSPARSTAPDKSSTHGDDYDITEEVMTLLGTTPLRDTVRRNLRETLNRYALRMRGIERGRELSRASLKTKDNRIAELQQRVATLENERKADRRHIRALGRGLEALYGDEASDTE